MTVRRNGKTYPVVEVTDTEVCVECEFEYYGGEVRKLLLWWSKDLVEFIPE